MSNAIGCLIDLLGECVVGSVYVSGVYLYSILIKKMTIDINPKVTKDRLGICNCHRKKRGYT